MKIENLRLKIWITLIGCGCEARFVNRLAANVIETTNEHE